MPSEGAGVVSPTLVDPSDARWARFAGAHPDALPFHRPAWMTTLRETYDFRPFVLLLVRQGGDVLGGLPLMEVKDPVRGTRWIALPFTDRCPPLVHHPAAARALADAVRRSAEGAGVSRAEVRAQLGGWHQTTVATMHVLDLTREPSELLRGFSSASRRNVRKAQRAGVVVHRAVSETELTEVYYRLHLRTRRRLGVPVQPRRFFRSLWRHQLEPGYGHLLLASVGQRAVAGAVFLDGGETVVYKYGASDERAWSLRPNNLLFWEAIRAAADARYRHMDFGRSELADTGLRSFKAGLGAIELPLVYSAPEGQDASLGPRVGRVLSTVIRRSPPAVCRAIGEGLYRYAA